jgi:AbrB family looped-hinge helix DNA binding protein
MEKTEVQRRFTTTIPKRARESLGLKEGTGLFWDVEEGRMVVYPATYASLDGVLKGKGDYSRKAKEAAEEWFLGQAKG